MARIEAFGPARFVHLSRPDKVAQAVSRTRALQTGLWHATPEGTERDRLAPPQEPRYDRARIDAHVVDLTAQDDAWRAWSAAQEIAPVAVRGDALAADPGAAPAGVPAALGLDPRRSGRRGWPTRSARHGRGASGERRRSA